MLVTRTGKGFHVKFVKRQLYNYFSIKVGAERKVQKGFHKLILNKFQRKKYLEKFLDVLFMNMFQWRKDQNDKEIES